MQLWINILDNYWYSYELHLADYFCYILYVGM